jgi:hypothetical protein
MLWPSQGTSPSALRARISTNGAGLLKMVRQRADCAERPGLGHAPRVYDFEIVSLLEPAHHGFRNRRAAHQHQTKRIQVVRFGLCIQQLQDADPECGYAARNRHPLALHQLDQAGRIEEATRQYQ